MTAPFQHSNSTTNSSQSKENVATGELTQTEAAGLADTRPIETCFATACVPVFRSKWQRSYPKHSATSFDFHLPIGDALRRTYDSDAHFGAYYCHDVLGRLSKKGSEGAVGAHHLHKVYMVVFVADIDCDEAHQSGEPAPETWRASEMAKVTDLFRQHIGGFCYQTRGGYRLVYKLEAPFLVAGDEGDVAWTLRYMRILCHLARKFDIIADPCCADWTRLFRLPKVAR